jgi:hypothetical protein
MKRLKDVSKKVIAIDIPIGLLDALEIEGLSQPLGTMLFFSRRFIGRDKS